MEEVSVVRVVGEAVGRFEAPQFERIRFDRARFDRIRVDLVVFDLLVGHGLGA